VFQGSGAPGSGQRIVELATNGDVEGLRDLLDASYGGGVGASGECDASTRAIIGAQIRTAAQRAAHAGQAQTLRVLIERGADLGLRYGNGRCVAVEAAARGHADVLEVLLAEAGAGTEVQNGYGRTCLLEAAKEGHVACVRVALRNGADINFATKNANATAAMFAAAENRVGCLNVLREAGCDLTVTRALDGKTALQIHAETVRNEMRKVLGNAHTSTSTSN
jgi:ankyrin repeat protein